MQLLYLYYLPFSSESEVTFLYMDRNSFFARRNVLQTLAETTFGEAQDFTQLCLIFCWNICSLENVDGLFPATFNALIS